jgi:hypothetical protein
MPTTIPSVVACAKIRIAVPINTATIQSALMEPSHRLTPLTTSLPLGWSTTAVDGINMRRVGPKLVDHQK